MKKQGREFKLTKDEKAYVQTAGKLLVDIYSDKYPTESKSITLDHSLNMVPGKITYTIHIADTREINNV